jgi:hypothetical protein
VLLDQEDPVLVAAFAEEVKGQQCAGKTRPNDSERSSTGRRHGVSIMLFHAASCAGHANVPGCQKAFGIGVTR